MSRQHHYIDIETNIYQLIEKGERTFLVIKFKNKFHVYDILHFDEVVGEVKTGRSTGYIEIKYILINEQGLEPGYCVISWDWSKI